MQTVLTKTLLCGLSLSFMMPGLSKDIQHYMCTIVLFILVNHQIGHLAILTIFRVCVGMYGFIVRYFIDVTFETQNSKRFNSYSASRDN